MERSRQNLHCCRNSDIIGRGWDGRQQGLNLQNYCIKEARVDLTCCTLPHPSRKLEQNENTLKILFQIISTKGSLLHRVRYLCYARARARACVCVCMVQWFVQSISNRNIAGSIPAEYSHIRLSSPSLSPVVTNSQMCMSEYECVVEKKYNYKKMDCRWPKTASGRCVVQDQAPQQWWSIRSALQPDRWCSSGKSNMRMRI